MKKKGGRRRGRERRRTKTKPQKLLEGVLGKTMITTRSRARSYDCTS